MSKNRKTKRTASVVEDIAQQTPAETQIDVSATVVLDGTDQDAPSTDATGDTSQGETDPDATVVPDDTDQDAPSTDATGDTSQGETDPDVIWQSEIIAPYSGLPISALQAGQRIARENWKSGFYMQVQPAIGQKTHDLSLMMNGNRCGPIELESMSLADMFAEDWIVLDEPAQNA